MATIDQQTFKYLEEEMSKEVHTYQTQLEKQVQRELAKKKFVGTPQMQLSHREAEQNRLNNEAQKKLMVHETKLGVQYFKEYGGSLDMAQKLLNHDKVNSEFNKQSAETQKYVQEDKLKEAKTSLRDSWNSTAKQDRGMDMER